MRVTIPCSPSEGTDMFTAASTSGSTLTLEDYARPLVARMRAGWQHSDNKETKRIIYSSLCPCKWATTRRTVWWKVTIYNTNFAAHHGMQCIINHYSKSCSIRIRFICWHLVAGSCQEFCGCFMLFPAVPGPCWLIFFRGVTWLGRTSSMELADFLRFPCKKKGDFPLPG